MKVWVIVDKDGKIWTYTNKVPVIYQTRRGALEMARKLHKPSGYRPARASLRDFKVLGS